MTKQNKTKQKNKAKQSKTKQKENQRKKKERKRKTHGDGYWSQTAPNASYNHSINFQEVLLKP